MCITAYPAGGGRRSEKREDPYKRIHSTWGRNSVKSPMASPIAPPRMHPLSLLMVDKDILHSSGGLEGLRPALTLTAVVRERVF